jgi:rhodanese-related sulfurtransferase
MFLTPDENTKAINDLLNQSSPVDCAVAFLGGKSKDVKFPKDSRIICNLSLGGTNPHAIEALQKKGLVEIRQHKTLHAKTYITKNEGVVSSANLSANGLGYEDSEMDGWVETGYKVTNPIELEKMKSWFDIMWNNEKIVTPISPDDIEKAKVIWSKRRRIRDFITDRKKSFLDELKNNPDSFKDKGIYVVLYTAPMSDNAEKTLKNAQKSDVRADAYQEWDDLPENSTLIDFKITDNHGEFGGIFKTDTKTLLTFTDDDGKESRLFICHKQSHKAINNLRISANDIKLLEAKAIDIFNANISSPEEEAIFVPIIDVRSILFP